MLEKAGRHTKDDHQNGKKKSCDFVGRLVCSLSLQSVSPSLPPGRHPQLEPLGAICLLDHLVLIRQEFLLQKGRLNAGQGLLACILGRTLLRRSAPWHVKAHVMWGNHFRDVKRTKKKGHFSKESLRGSHAAETFLKARDSADGYR